jgi:hypothetical protein
MPAFAVTAVDTSAETLTAVGHGLLTGDRFRLRNIGGALPAATPALAPVTDYFAIRVDNDKIKVAVSSSDAFVPTPVNLTGSGSGTTYIEYGLPYCIPRIAVQGSQIKSADDNAAWNALVAIYDLLTGQTQSVWTGITLPANQHVTVSGTGEYKHGDITIDIPPFPGGGLAGGVLTGFPIPTTGGGCAYPLHLPKGTRIKSATITMFGNGTVDGGANISKTSPAGGLVVLDSVTLTNVPASNTDYTINAGSLPYTLGTKESAYIGFDNANAAGMSVIAMQLVIDRP